MKQDMKESLKPFRLPQSFLMGSATASVQIEGGDVFNNWYRFCENGRTKDGSHCIVADDHWNRVEEDIELMKELNHKVYRMSIEWSRIEPEKGKFCEEPLSHYRSEIQKLLDNGIQPLVTLHHFSQPIWFEDMGGWVNKESPQLFLRYTEKVVSFLGDLVSDWVTINEPNVYMDGTYFTANFPPEKPSITSYFRATRNMTHAHIGAYKLIHGIRTKKGHQETKVGIALHIRVFDAYKNQPLSRLMKNVLDYCFHVLFLEGMMRGKYKFPIGMGGYPQGKNTYCDFFGLNYYSRDMVRFVFKPGKMFSDLLVKEDAKTNDMGWEIYPEGLYRICKKYWKMYGKPIYITENGICDEKDIQRTRFIYDHLHEVKKLIDEGVAVERYYHWTLLDNFEWDDGTSRRFGLIEVDYSTQKRSVRKSGRFFGEAAKDNEITKDMIDRYI